MKLDVIDAPPAPPPPQRRFILELNEYEAEALLCVATRVGGSPTVSRRRVFDFIQRSLHNAGVREPRGVVDMGKSSTFLNSVYFKEELPE